MTDEPQVAQTPLIDLLRGTPKDATADYEHNPTSYSHIPYGYQAHQAADEIDRLNELLELGQKARTHDLRVQQEQIDAMHKNTLAMEAKSQRRSADADRIARRVVHMVGHIRKALGGVRRLHGTSEPCAGHPKVIAWHGDWDDLLAELEQALKEKL